MIYDDNSALAAFRAAFDVITDALAIATAADFPIGAHIVYVNTACTQLSGYTREQLLGHSCVLLAGARPDIQHVREVVGASRDDTLFASTRKFRPDGTAYDVDMWLSPLREGSGVVTHYLLRQRDMTNHNPGRPQLEAQRLLVESVNSASQVVSGIAHEVDQPDAHLHVVLAALEGIRDAAWGA
jgi:PAS domain S-box-containing protein